MNIINSNHFKLTLFPGLLFFCLLQLVFSGTVLAGESLSQIIEASHRSTENISRNSHRHPVETLKFFELERDMTVVEIWPGAGGWYTEILAPYLRDKGTLYAAHFAADSEVKFFRDSLDKFKQKTANDPTIYDKIILSELDAPRKVTLAPPGSADRVLTFRNVHNWLRQDENGYYVFKAMYEALKPGGILGVVEHRAPADFSLEDMQTSGYTTEAFTIALAERAGFKLLAKSEINANPKDNKHHPKGVWTLPPSLRLGDQDKEKYLAIGESDRMTLKFIKPKK
ncbi:MAG TPA: methyltransferase [Pseudomonadales bacterium]